MSVYAHLPPSIILTLTPRRYYCWFCAHTGSWILEPFWYYLSDLSVFFIYRFVMATRDVPPATIPTKLALARKMETSKKGEQALLLSMRV